MRPTRTTQSSLDSPLNRILGTEANVRLLRVLAQAREPLTRAEAARRAQLDSSGVRRVLDALAVEGIVELSGADARVSVRLRDAHPLAPALQALFAAERDRARDLSEAIRGAARRLAVQPTALWITSAPPGELHSVYVGVVARARQVGGIVRELRPLLNEVQRSHDVLIDIHLYTMADLRTLSSGRREELMAARTLLGPEPPSLIPEDAPATSGQRAAPEGHARLDRRALRMARAIGDRILRDPAVIDRAREYARRVAASSPGVREEMEEWQSILDTLPPARLRAFLADPGERATRLRQSLPFVDVLTSAERDALFREAEHDA